MSAEKSRNFTFLIYEDSSPNHWMDKLETLGLPIAISPLHDKDKSKVEGQNFKKPHYHCIYVAKNPVTADSVRKKLKRLLGKEAVNKVQIIHSSIENMFLYLTHESKDAKKKNKHVYNKQDIKLLNNFDIDRYITLDVEDKDYYFDLICDLIEHFKLTNLIMLRNFIRNQGDDYGLNIKDLNKIIATKTSLLRLLFDGAYQEELKLEKERNLQKDDALTKLERQNRKLSQDLEATRKAFTKEWNKNHNR